MANDRSMFLSCLSLRKYSSSPDQRNWRWPLFFVYIFFLDRCSRLSNYACKQKLCQVMYCIYVYNTQLHARGRASCCRISNMQSYVIGLISACQTNLTGDKSCEKLAFSLGMAAYFSSINFAGSCKLSRHWPGASQLHLFEFIH